MILPLSLDGVGWTPPPSQGRTFPAILTDINLEVQAREWLAIKGASGSGKTTLLSICGGLMAPTVGTVKLFGHRLKDQSEVERAHLRAQTVGMIFQNYQLDDSRTTKDNLLLAAYFCKRPWHALEARANQLAEKLEITDYFSRPVSVLSGGQRQRVAVGRALLLEPKLILADEPTGALDEISSQLVLDLLNEERQQGAALITVSHDERISRQAPVQLLLAQGRLTRLDNRVQKEIHP